METEINSIEQKNSIKLVRNSRGYNWEIKIYSNENDATLKEIARLNEELNKKYGLNEPK